MCVVVCTTAGCFYMQQLNNTSQKQQTRKNNTNKHKTFEKNNTNIQLIQPEPERYLFAVEWWAGGCPVFLFVCVLFECFIVCCLFVVVVAFAESFRVVACISEQIIVNTNKQTTFEQKQQTNKYSSSSRNLNNIYSRPSGGLDVLYCFALLLLFI